MVCISMTYYYKGSSNSTLYLYEDDYGLRLVTDYGETIATVGHGGELLRVLEKLANDGFV